MLRSAGRLETTLFFCMATIALAGTPAQPRAPRALGSHSVFSSVKSFVQKLEARARSGRRRSSSPYGAVQAPSRARFRTLSRSSQPSSPEPEASTREAPSGGDFDPAGRTLRERLEQERDDPNGVGSIPNIISFLRQRQALGSDASSLMNTIQALEDRMKVRKAQDEGTHGEGEMSFMHQVLFARKLLDPNQRSNVVDAIRSGNPASVVAALSLEAEGVLRYSAKLLETLRDDVTLPQISDAAAVLLEARRDQAIQRQGQAKP